MDDRDVSNAEIELAMEHATFLADRLQVSVLQLGIMLISKEWVDMAFDANVGQESAETILYVTEKLCKAVRSLETEVVVGVSMAIEDRQRYIAENN